MGAHIGTVPNDFVFQLFPSLHTALDEELRTQAETLGGQISELFWVVGESTAKTTQSVGSTENDRVSYPFCSLEGVVYRGNGG